MLHEPLFLALRLLHVIGGVFWAGSVFLLAGFIALGSSRARDDEGFVGRLLIERRLIYSLVGSSLIAIGSGVGLFRRFYGHAHWDWSHPHQNEVYAVGFIAAVLAFVVMIAYAIPAGIALRNVRDWVDASRGAPPESLRAEYRRVVQRNAVVWRTTAAFLSITVTTMAVGRYIF